MRRGRSISIPRATWLAAAIVLGSLSCPHVRSAEADARPVPRTGGAAAVAAADASPGDTRVLEARQPIAGDAQDLGATSEHDAARAIAASAAPWRAAWLAAALLLPTLLAALLWGRERGRALQERLRQQTALLDMRAYTESIVQSLNAVVWEARREEPADGDDADATPAWRFTFVSDHARELLGKPLSTWWEARDLWTSCALPEERARVCAFYQAVADGLSTDGIIDFRATPPRSGELWLRDRVSVIREDGRVHRMRGVLVDVTEKRRAERTAAALLAVASDVSGSVDRAEMLTRVLHRTLEVVPCDRALLFHADGVGARHRVIAHDGIPAALAEHVAALSFAPGEPFGGLVEGGETVALNDPRTQPWLPLAFFDELGIAALVAVPVPLQDGGLATLVAVSALPAGGPFDGRQVGLIEGIARQLAVGLRVAELHAEQREQALVANALAWLGRLMIAAENRDEMLERLTRATRETLECDASLALLPSTDGESFTIAACHGVGDERRGALPALHLPLTTLTPLLDRMARGVVTLRESSLPDDVTSLLRGTLDVRQLLCIPLVHDGRTLGVLCAGYRDGNPSERHLRIARGLGEIASSVLDRLQLVTALESANRVRSEFIATMSHELRTPLHVITGYQEMLLDGALGDLGAEQRNVLERSRSSAMRLLDLVNFTLDLSRLDAGAEAAELAEVPPGPLVEDVIDELRDLDPRRRIELCCAIEPALPQLLTDARKLRVVVKNLVANALKFTDEGSVTASVRRAGDGIEVEIADTGIGIPADALLLIFEPFRQVDASNTRRHGGAGLGLHIAKRLADLLGATITVESTVGAGSTFRLHVPREAASLRNRAA